MERSRGQRDPAVFSWGMPFKWLKRRDKGGEMSRAQILQDLFEQWCLMWVGCFCPPRTFSKVVITCHKCVCVERDGAGEPVKLLSRVRLFATPWTMAYQAPRSMEFSRQEYWSGLPFPLPGDLPNLGAEPRSPSFQEDALPSEPPLLASRGWKPRSR